MPDHADDAREGGELDGELDPDDNPWTTKLYPRGTQGYERVILFSDAVFAIALTLLVVQIAVPAISGNGDNSEMLQAIGNLGSNIFAFAFSFLWVAFYWKANHRFTTTLKAMSSRYITVVLVYLLFIAFLPFPSSLIGEYWNPVALAFFLLYMGCLSTMETILGLVARIDHLYVRELTPGQFRRWAYSALAPVAGAFISAPLAFVNMYAALAAMLGISLGLAAVARRIFPERL